MSMRKEIIGTWKSDRKRTLEIFAPYHRQKDKRKKRKISGMFGKLEIKFTKKYFYSYFDDTTAKNKYEIIDESEDTLVIKTDDKFPNGLGFLDGICYFVIQFDETRYYKYCSIYNSRWNYVEWFREQAQPNQ